MFAIVQCYDGKPVFDDKNEFRRYYCFVGKKKDTGCYAVYQSKEDADKVCAKLNAKPSLVSAVNANRWSYSVEEVSPEIGQTLLYFNN